MSSAIVTIEIEDLGVDAQGVKEAAVMALERLGGARVLHVDVREPEQLGMDGAAAHPSAPPRRPSSGASREAPKPRQGRPGLGGVPCCMNCGHYHMGAGNGENGQLYWGVCREAGRPVYKLLDRCGAWRPDARR